MLKGYLERKQLSTKIKTENMNSTTDISKKILSELRENKIHIKLSSDSNIEMVSYGKNLSGELIDKIRSNKESLIAYLKENNIELGAIPLLKKATKYPLSSAQRRLWIIDRFEGSSASFNMPFTRTLSEDINIEFFKQAVIDTIERHEILRTVFVEDEVGEVWQKILSLQELNFTIDIVDFSEEEDSRLKVNEYIKKDASLPFDLEKGPLIRVAVLRVSKNELQLYYNMHHIISDGWSLEVAANDIMAFYKAYINGAEPEISELKIQYKDYASWQISQLKTEELIASKKYWEKSLSGEIPLLNLPSTKTRPVLKTYNGNSLRSYISKDITGALKSITRANGGSLYMGIMAALNVLLYKYTSEKDIVIGSPISGRDRFELKNQIGFYLNILPLRNRINPEENFTFFLKKVIENTLTSYKYQSYPFDNLVEDLNLTFDKSRSPIFDISVTYNNITAIEGSLEKSKIDEIRVLGDSICKNDIEFHFHEIDGHLSFDINYNSDVYEQDVMMRFMNNFKKLLSNLFENPATPLKDINYLSDQEELKLLHEFNDTWKPFDLKDTVLDLFKIQVEKTPQDVAVVFNDTTLTYQELDVASTKVANHIIEEYNIERNDIVGIELNRNEWMIVAILGVLKSGAAYVPINPSLPLERKTHIQEDTNIKLLVTETSFMFDLDYFDGDVFAIDVEYDTLENTKPIEDRVSSKDLAYVIYTSGSTGIPKGVMVEHKSFLSSILLRNDYYLNLKSMLAITPFSFDASVGILWNSLTTGAEYHILDEDSIKNPSYVVNYIKENNVELLCSTPSFYSFVLKDSEFKNTSLKRVITGGESFSTTLVTKHFETHPNSKLFNEYGPTENTIWTTVKEIKEDYKRNVIGKPLNNNKIFLLNEDMELVPLGAKGEIFIGGENLAKGYLNSSELTSKRFISNPFNEEEVLYRTGDFGKWTTNGEIEFIGRQDNQIKVRGFRVELGEIENQIQAKNDIEEVAVIASKDGNGQNELIAFLVSKKEQNLKDLKDFLQEKLPEYMVPAKYIQIEKFPLSINGKVDKSKLNKEQGNILSTGFTYVAPQTRKETLLIEMIQEVLGVDKVGMNDDFFLIGGNSIKLIEVILKLKQEGFAINISDIVKNPNIKEMASLLKEVEYANS